jgi:hypothetical protein
LSGLELSELAQEKEATLNGLEAISAANGWSMAIIGAIIVMMGLAVLSFIISLFPKAVVFLEKRVEKRKQEKDKLKSGSEVTEEKPMSARVDHRLCDFEKMIRLYQPLIENLGESFQLGELYVVSQKNDLPHPHLTIRTLREAGILVQKDDGSYCLKK